MKVENKIAPNEDQINGFLEDPELGPISMVNLLKYKKKAIYADGRNTNLTGKEAYQLYAAEVIDFVEKYGVINKGCGCARKKRVRVAAEAYVTLAQHLHANPHLGDEVLRLAKTYRVVLNHEGTELCQLGIHREQEE